MNTQYNQHHEAPVAAAAYPPPPTSYPPPAGDGYKYNNSYVMAPPPMGYPTKDGETTQQHINEQTTSRGGGFFKGCLAGLCCCWCFDICCF